MRWNIGSKITTTFIFVAVIYAVVAVSSYQGQIKNEENQKWVAHTFEVLQNLDQVLSALTDTETGERGYLLTGTDAYLEPYNQGSQKVNDAVNKIQELTADNPKEQVLINAIRPLAAAKLEVAQETIDLRRDQGKGLEAALKLVRTNKGKNIMDQIRTLVGEMKVNEHNLLDERNKDAESSAGTLRLVIAMGTLLSVLILIGAGLWLTSSIARPIRALTSVAERIAKDDLTVKIEAETGRTRSVNYSDPCGQW